VAIDSGNIGIMSRGLSLPLSPPPFVTPMLISIELL